MSATEERMTSLEIERRVEAWFQANPGHMDMRARWQACCNEHTAASPQADGLLVSMMRSVWGGQRNILIHFASDDELVRRGSHPATIGVGIMGLTFQGWSLGEACILALEGAGAPYDRQRGRDASERAQERASMPEWLSASLTADGYRPKVQRAFGLLYDRISPLLAAGNFDDIAWILHQLSNRADEIDPVILVSGLRLTWFADSMIEGWRDSYEKIAESLRQRGHDTDAVLHGLLIPKEAKK